MQDRSIAELEQELTTLAGHLNAGNYRWLMLLAEFDARHGYAGEGIASCAHWVSWRCGLNLTTAREKVRVARALQHLPKLSDAMRRGVISYCIVRALTRVATADNEEQLLRIAEAGTVSHVQKLVRMMQREERARELDQANTRHASRYLQAYVAEDGCVVVKGLLSPEQGALFMKALRGACDALREAEDASREVFAAPDSTEDRHGARNADALECLAESFLAHGHTPLAGRERHVVHVHVDEAVLRDAEVSGRCEVEGSAVPPATLQRLCCDASLVTVVEDASGAPKALSRKTRVVSTPLGRALAHRDGGCRFPGCANTRFVHAHHIEHWAHGGPTTLANLLTLCTRHHRFLHEYGYRVVMRDGAPQFLQPNGQEVITMPKPAPIDAAEGCQRLMDAHAELGIDADTGDSHWGGERMDYEWALLALMGPPGPELDASSADS